MTESIQIGARRIGHGFPVYCIAEVSANHNQSFDEAVRIIRAAKDADADAIKLQTYTPDTMTIDSTRRSCSVSGTDPSINTITTSAASMAPCVRTEA